MMRSAAQIQDTFLSFDMRVSRPPQPRNLFHKIQVFQVSTKEGKTSPRLIIPREPFPVTSDPKPSLDNNGSP